MLIKKPPQSNKVIQIKALNNSRNNWKAFKSLNRASFKSIERKIGYVVSSFWLIEHTVT